MRILIAEDDYASRKFLYKLFSQYGECDMTVDGIETVEAFVAALDSGDPYDLLCLDIMMPKIDGIKALETIRSIEKKRKITDSDRIRVIIISALDETEVGFAVPGSGREIYITKPVNTDIIYDAVKKLELI
ncbi:MAG: response regulator transcription factor [Clostridiales bacterium]|nr:response regulator transcription factor [Clostridiales bacterium]